jgi:hypothetical protein
VYDGGGGGGGDEVDVVVDDDVLLLVEGVVEDVVDEEVVDDDVVDDVGGVPVGSVKSRRFRDPEPALFTTPGVAAPASADATALGDAPGFCARYSAAVPATCGVAIEVPLSVAVPPLL